MSVPVLGNPPDLIGKPLQSLRWQGYVHNGEPVDGACLIYLLVEGEWHRLALDQGTVHWHRELAEPKTWSVPEEGWEYPVRDLDFAAELTGIPIAAVVVSGGGDHASVEIRLESGRKLVFEGRGDENAAHAV